MRRAPLIVVAGALANKPGNGGAAWTRLSWALGLRRLGCEVYFFEQIADCADAAGGACDLERSINLAYFAEVIDRFGLDGHAALFSGRDGHSAGLGWNEAEGVADRADLLINISGNLTLDTLKPRFRKRAFIDQDPGYTQFWHQGGLADDRLRDHHFYFTVGENIGTRECGIPTGGIAWRPVRQPVVLDQWPPAAGESHTRFTTVGSWRGPYGRVTFEGRLFGVKAHEFRRFVSLPALSGQQFEIALAIDAADRRDVDALHEHAWRLVDPGTVASDPFRFRSYVQDAGAEFSVAQGIYVETRSGWFSDRTARYLASGKPALVQDTGFASNYPTGRGLVAFRTLDEAAQGARAIARDYRAHSRAARAIAEEFFDSDTVIGRFLRDVNVT
jgi:hypothetical protein